jgi:hypothetical protein
MPSSNHAPVFYFEWGGAADLDVDEIWPDGDAPENPTVADVMAQIQKSGSTPRSVARDWNLEIEEIEVSGPGGRQSYTDSGIRVWGQQSAGAASQQEER